MNRSGRKRVTVGLAAALLLSGAVTLAVAAAASAAASLTVSPDTNLSNGQMVSVSGAGFADSAQGAIVECNNDPGQPTISVLGNNVPVSCTNPLGAVTSTTATGDLAATNFTIVEGTVGPPKTGTDSGGGDAATDAATYPCPPTAAQVTAGDACTLSFGDTQGDQVGHTLSFGSGGGGGTTTTTASTTTTTTTSSTTTTTVPCTAASASSGGTPDLTVDPGTCLNGGSVVNISGSGFDPNSAGALLECNSDPNQATFSVAGNNAPVSCSNPLSEILQTDGSGNVASTSFTIVAGVVGPPGSGTDSVGKDAAADAANYPCPPTAAQAAAGDTCYMAYGDAGGKEAKVTISFVPAPTPAGSGSSSGAGGTGTSQGGGSATATISHTAAVTTPSSLAFTGPGRGVWELLIGGLVLINLGFLVLTIYYRPRQLLAIVGRRVHRIFGGRT